MNKALCWIRRDLRSYDHHALSVATQIYDQVDVIFVFDEFILSKLLDKKDARLTFIIESLQCLEKKGLSIHLVYGKPQELIPKMAEKLKVKCVLCNRDYEPYAKKRDDLVAKNLKNLGIEFEQFKDHVMMEKHEVLTQSRGIYKVFTPYKNQWLKVFNDQGQNTSTFNVNLKKISSFKNEFSTLTYDWHKALGFIPSPPVLKGGEDQALKKIALFKNKLSNYKKNRDIPSLDGTSSLSVYIRHGNISIREMVRLALTENSEGSQVWLSEIIWRDFYQMILETHPYVAKSSFKKEYDQIKWLGSRDHFKAWCEGQTGVPIIDASMRCLNATGLMHNRLRMIVASFLCKILLIDWRLGEEYFAQKLLDFDLAANSGGWQWSSSSGCDAQPYFRIFNPYTQSEKFDEDGTFIKVWCPELSTLSKKEIHRPTQITPIVHYETQRIKALSMYSAIKS